LQQQNQGVIHQQQHTVDFFWAKHSGHQKSGGANDAEDLFVGGGGGMGASTRLVALGGFFFSEVVIFSEFFSTYCQNIGGILYFLYFDALKGSMT